MQRDPVEALYWHSEAARTFLRDFSIDESLREGETAEELLDAAKELRGRHDMAKLLVGMMYLKGEGVEADDSEALYWLNDARQDHRVTLRDLADKVLADWRSDLPQEPIVLEESFPQTQFGEAIL